LGLIIKWTAQATDIQVDPHGIHDGYFGDTQLWMIRNGVF